MPENLTWDALVAATKRRREMAEQLAQADQPLKIALGNGRFKVVSRDLETPSDWRITYFDERGPSGHCGYRDARSAFFDAIGIV